MKAAKRVAIVLFATIIAIPVAVFAGFIVVLPAVNDARASKIEHDFSDLVLPPQSEIVETFSLCFNSSGTGNHVEILAGFVIKSELSEAMLSEWAETVAMRYPAYDATVRAAPEELFARYPNLQEGIRFEQFDGATECYVVSFLFDAVTQMDIRGH